MTAVWQAGLESLATVKDWRLNERHYGALTGLNKAACVDTWGPEQVTVGANPSFIATAIATVLAEVLAENLAAVLSPVPATVPSEDLAAEVYCWL